MSSDGTFSVEALYIFLVSRLRRGYNENRVSASRVSVSRVSVSRVSVSRVSVSTHSTYQCTKAPTKQLTAL